MPGIDGLRALAIALVIVIHVFPGSRFPGEVGVDIFFVISGFLITLILLRQLDRTGGIALKRFYINRAVRLYPPLLVVATVTVLLGVLPNISLVDAARSAALSLVYLGNVYMTLSGRWLGDLSHTWSLAMEEQFYLVWPAVLLLAIRRTWTRRAILVALLVVTVAMLTGWLMTGEATPMNPLTRGFGLVVGCVLALVTQRSRWESERLAWTGLAMLAAMLAATMVGAVPHVWTVPIAVVASCPLILHLAYGTGPLVAFFSHRSLVFTGLISYEIYLWHYVVLAMLFRTTDLPQWIVGIVGVTLTVGLSIVTYRTVSRPVLQWRDRRRASVR